MILENALQDILTFCQLDSLRIPDNYITALSSLLDLVSSLEFFLPINLAIRCILFLFGFALACGLIKVVINK